MLRTRLCPRRLAAASAVGGKGAKIRVSTRNGSHPADLHPAWPIGRAPPVLELEISRGLGVLIRHFEIKATECLFRKTRLPACLRLLCVGGLLMGEGA